MTEFIVRMANRPGMLASLTETLADAGVNIDALAAFGLDGEGVVRLIVDDARAARRAMAAAGLAFQEHQVLSTHLPNRPGALAAVARKLADAAVNIDAIYILSANTEGLELAIAVDQPETALPHLQVRGAATA